MLLPLPSTVLMLCFLLQSAHVVSSAAASDDDSSLLELHVGLNLSMSANSTSMFNYAITAYGNGAYFLPFLSSSGFNSTNSSESLGFSVGFLFSASNDHSYSINIYLAVCGGLSGNYSPSYGSVHLGGSDDGNVLNMSSTPINPYGYVVPVWIANLDNPLRSVKSSLVVVEGSDVGAGGSSSNELQLRDHDGRVVWRVRNVSRMQMQDTGNLVIYESMNTTNVVWQSAAQPTDTLVPGQRLTVGMQLTSSDSSYLARMEKGGLVLYDNHAQFVVEQPSPYWVIPILFNTRASNVFDLNTLVFSPPCNNPNDADYGTVTNFASLSFRGTGSIISQTVLYFLDGPLYDWKPMGG